VPIACLYGVVELVTVLQFLACNSEDDKWDGSEEPGDGGTASNRRIG